MKELFKTLYRRARSVIPHEPDWTMQDIAEDAIEEYLHLNGQYSLTNHQAWRLYDAVLIAIEPRGATA